MNSIMFSDAFPLPQIDISLQSAITSNWLLSFDPVQGYLLLAMEEDITKLTTFRGRSLGLYGFA